MQFNNTYFSHKVLDVWNVETYLLEGDRAEMEILLESIVNDRKLVEFHRKTRKRKQSN